MKKIISLLITLAMLIACLPVAVYAEDVTVTYAGGSGTSTDPYQIATAAQLKYMRDTVNNGDGKSDVGKYWVLTADIDLNGVEWIPIGWAIGIDKDGNKNNNYEFSGTFDGAGYVIKNYKITEASPITNATASMIKEGDTKYCNNVGLFGGVQGGTIKNLGVEDVTFEIDSPNSTAISISRAGALAGRVTGTITNCYAKNVKINKIDPYVGVSVGGLVGMFRGKSTITNCYVYGLDITTSYSNKISAGAFAYGSENANNGSTYINCYAANITTSGLTSYYGCVPEIRGGSPEPTFTNCWSTDINGSGANESGSRGNIGATKEGIITALVDNGDGSFVIDKNVNNGYPCLSFEKTEMVPATAFAGGDGKSADTAYEIATAEQLIYFRNLINGTDTNGTYEGKYYELTADIDLGGEEWEPIGWNKDRDFAGKFNGNGHVVKNFKITQYYGGYLGFFGHLSNNVEISNFGIENEIITHTDDKISPDIAGFAVRGGGKFTNCYVKNSTVSTVKGSYGGFFHSLRGAGTFENCYVYNANVSVPDGSNGIAGFVLSAENDVNSTFTNCYVADVTTTKTDIYTLPFSVAWSRNAYNNSGITKEEADASTDKLENGCVVHTITNCWSTMKYHVGTKADNIENKRKAPCVIYPDAVTCADTDEATKDQIRAAFIGVSGYQINDAINDGFPSLAYETVEEDTNYVVAAVVPGDKVYVKLIEKEAVAGSTVYVATYNNSGRLLAAEAKTVAAPYEFTTNISTSDAYTVKVFVWNGNQTPIAEVYEGKIIDGKLVDVGELSYSVKNGVMTIEYANDITDYASFADTPWSGEGTVTKIVLGSNVTGIGENAFSGFTNLESVEIPETVTKIADNAFPARDFTIYGYANGAAEEYADANNKTFQLKKLRILTIGNSHTSDHGQWNKEIWGDIADAGIETEIVYQRVTNGGFKMYYEDSFDTNGYSKSHYAQANNPSSPYYARYAEQLDNYTWDIVLIQDYRESSVAKEDFTDAMAKTTKWLRSKQPNAKIGWIVDWNDKNNGTNDRARLQTMFYDNTIAAVNNVMAMPTDGPDIIIPMGTAMQNVRTTYLWDVYNAADCYTKYTNTDWCGSAEKIVTYNLLERDGTHCSYELCRYIMGAAVFGYIYSLYQDKLIGGNVVDFCDALKTMPVTTGADEWKGEFTDSIWDIIEETTENTIANPWTITNSVYTVDPAIAKAVEVVNATYADFTPAGIVATIKALGNGFTVSESDIAIDGDTATVRFLYGYSEKTVTISK